MNLGNYSCRASVRVCVCVFTYICSRNFLGFSSPKDDFLYLIVYLQGYDIVGVAAVYANV